MPRLSRLARLARLLPYLLAAAPTAASTVASADVPDGDATPVAEVPAYAVAAPAYVAPPAYAVAAPGYAAPMPVAAEDDSAEAVGIDRRVQEDQVAERSYLAPTALVAPRGTTTFTLQAPIAPGGSIRLDRSFGDRLSLGVGMIGFVADDNLVGIGSLHGKYQLWHGRRAALAATASIYNIPADSDVADGDSMNIVIPGFVGSMCTGDDCRTLVSVDVQALTGVDDNYLPIVGGISIASGIKRQLIVEVHTTTADGDRLFAGFVGGRFVGRRWAFDAGLGFGAVREHSKVGDCIDFCEEPADETSTDGAPYPFVALSSRL